ncbi:hypothetical protein [Silvimonas iriomotensis]|uniref:Uncharacterized protein n=1 Tax=Silvimonas iriomotensis TaxID=449662 RepID=A0ABQ2PAH0_9NEIS|nr:hypothetical protein [Silvimonas iriomotensis]GGP21887.1 hypothetical protein GCM10010970_22700 [Silvimonas iriomotensis]
MALIIRISNRTARLLRRAWIPKGTHGNTHAYAQDTPVGSLPLSATSLPAGFPVGQAPLTAEELATLEHKVFEPARLRERERLHEAREQQLDPQRRLTAAVALLQEAIPLTVERPLPARRLAELADVVTVLQNTSSPSPSQDPLHRILVAIHDATTAVGQGCYGNRPVDMPLKTSEVNITWTGIRNALLGTGETNLMRALQRGGWVKVTDAGK